MKHFNADEYHASRGFLKAFKKLNVYMYMVGKGQPLPPFRKGNRPWFRTDLYDEDGSPLYENTAVFDYILPNGKVVRIPAGFQWDGASIPKWAQWLIGKPMGKYALSALLHDWLYASRILGDTKKGRKQADKFFETCLQQQGISWWRRQAMFRAVRAGGAYAYHKTDETEECIRLMEDYHDYNPFGQYDIVE